ncbi:transposase [Streptomyces sp. NPDC055092]
MEAVSASSGWAVVDSQPVRGGAESIGTSTRGWDNGKKVGGCKRLISVDCLGMLLVTGASVQDRDAGIPLLEQLRQLHCETTLVWAAGGCSGWLVDFARDHLALALTLVKPNTTCAPSLSIKTAVHSSRASASGSFDHQWP